MRKFYKWQAVLLSMFFNFFSLLADIPVIFDISNPDNIPFSSLKIEIYPKDSIYIYKTVTTNSNGQSISSFPSGNYTYSINYGDWSTGSFSTENIDPNDENAFVWINVDFRQAVISLKSEDESPLPDEEVKVYRQNEDGTETLCKTKRSDENGEVRFILSEGKYRYVALLQQEAFEVKDQNIQIGVGTGSKHSVVQIYFGFKKDGQIINVLGNDVKLTQKSTGLLYGSAPAKSAPDGQAYSVYDGPVSCVPGDEYVAEVNTKEYGKLTATFTAYSNSEMRDIVYFIIPDNTGGQGGSGGSGSDGWPGIPGRPISQIEPGDEFDYSTLTIRTVWKTPETPEEVVPYVYYRLEDYQFMTNNIGEDYFFVLKGNTLTVSLLDQTQLITIDSDTTITLYLDDFIKTSFAFRLNGENFTPSSISEICVRSTDGKIYYCANNQFFCQPHLFCPVPLIGGDYEYKFSINEANYAGDIIGSFKIPSVTPEMRERDTTIYIDLVEKYEVNVITLDAKGDTIPFISGNIYKYKDGILQEDTNYDYGNHGMLGTNEAGLLTNYLFKGDYQMQIMGEKFDFSIFSDTTFTFRSSKNTKNVYFRFLHEGEVVYPQVMRMDILHAADSKSYSYIVSSIAKDTLGNEYRLFDKPVKCFAGDYIYQYQLNDFAFNGERSDLFDVSITGRNDTVIYILLPVKRNITITVKDKDDKDVINVFGTIYKYNDDGTLNTNPVYDGASHNELKTNDTGIIMDQLTPGKYQFRILDIVRDFIVGDFDLGFTVKKGVDYYTTTFIVKDVDNNPIIGSLLEVKKGEDYYGSNLTDDNGEIKIMNESGTYTYSLYYGETKDSTYHIFHSDTTITIVVPRLVYADAISIKGCGCLEIGETVQLFAEITPDDATFKNVNWSLNNQLYATIQSDGTLKANTAGLEGTVRVMAESKDGGGKSDTKTIRIATVCGANKIDLSIGENGIKDTVACQETIPLILGDVTGKTENQIHWFVYQYSEDAQNWANVKNYPDPVEDVSSIELRTTDYDPDKTVYFRVIAADSKETAENVSKGELDGACYSYILSSIVQLRPVEIVTDACQCIRPGGSMQIQAKTVPADIACTWAWGISENATDAAITPDGMLTVGNSYAGDSVTVVATLPNGKTEKIKIVVDAKCGILDVDLSIAKTGIKDTIFKNEEQIPLIVGNITGDSEIPADWRLYQYSYDQTAWQTISVQNGDTDFELNTADYRSRDTYFRVIVSTTEEAVRNAANGTSAGCAPVGISNAVKLRAVNLAPDNWPASVCSNAGSVELKLSAESLGSLKEDAGTKITWEKKGESNADFMPMTVPKEKWLDPSVTITEKTTFRVTITNVNANFTNSFEQEVDYVSALNFALKTSKDTVCKGEEVELQISNLTGSADSYLWYDGSTDAVNSRTVTAVNSIYWVRLTNVCSSVQDTFKIMTDDSVRVRLYAEKNFFCANSAPVKLWAEVEGTAGSYAWSHDAAAAGSEVYVSPTATAEYSVTATSLFGACPAAVAEEPVKIEVYPELKFDLKASKDTVCKGAEIKLQINNLVGSADSYLWYDGSTDAVSDRTVTAENKAYWVQLTNICFQKTDTVRLTVDSIRIKLHAEKEHVCESNIEPIRLWTEAEGAAGSYTWSHDAAAVGGEVYVQPAVTAEYKVTVTDKLNVCPPAEDKVRITVDSVNLIKLALDYGGDSQICQDGSQAVTLTASVTNEITPTEYIWFANGQQLEITGVPTLTDYPSENTVYSVQAGSDACTRSDTAYTDELKVNPANDVRLSVESTTVDYDSEVRLQAVTDEPFVGRYLWYAVQNGQTIKIGETGEPELLYTPTATASYYVDIENGACRTTKSSVELKLTDMTKIPTAITPYDKDGLNDDFMPGYKVLIFDRYGNLVCDCDNGWDGTYRGKLADPGVYLYSIVMKDRRKEKGTIEVVKIQ